MAREVWRFREFVLGSIKREFQTRYQRSQFGWLWAVLNPLAMILVYTLIFSEVMGARLPGLESKYAYSIYLCTGVLTWTLFAEIVMRSLNIFVDNANLMKKVAFPKVCLPLIVIGSSLLHFAIIAALFLIFLGVTSALPGWVALDAIPLLLVQVALAIGLGIFLGTINVFYRDVGQTMSIVLQFWFWLTPIVYVASIVPAPLQRLLEWNPMWPIVRGYQDIFVAGVSPHWASVAWPGILALVAMLLGMTAFARLQAEIVDDL
jgi:lipopolysaccharide transport system permease protein